MINPKINKMEYLKREIYQSNSGEKYDLTELLEWITNFGYEINDEIQQLNSYMDAAIESGDLTSKGLGYVIQSQSTLIQLNKALYTMRIDSEVQKQQDKDFDSISQEIIETSDMIIDAISIESANRSFLQSFYEVQEYALSSDRYKTELSHEYVESLKHNLEQIERLIKAIERRGRQLNYQPEDHDHSKV